MKDIFLLDMDDTLFDFERAERENFRGTLASFGLPCGDGVYARFHAINEGLWRLLERGGISREELKVRRFRDLFEEFRIDADASAVADAYWRNFPSVCFPFAGAGAFLEALAARGKIYIVSNGGAAIQERHLQDAGFLPYITASFISETIGAEKPSKAFSDYVISHIEGFDRSRAVWIGDSLTSDMVCAKNAGIDFILFLPRGESGDFAGHTARNYPEALSVIRSL